MANELRANYNGTANLYAVIRRQSDARVWNGSAFVTWSDADITAYAIALTGRGGDMYSADMPATIPAGTYYVDFYIRAGASAATGDLRSGGDTLNWSGAATTLDPDDVTAADMVVRIKRALATNGAVVSMVTVDGQIVQYNRAQAIDELRFWQREAGAELGTRPRVASINLSSGFSD